MTRGESMQLSIVLPTYNEVGNIVDLVETIRACVEPEGWTYEMIVVDDDSPDGTAEAVRTHITKTAAPVRVIVRRGERGLATAIRRGIEESAGEIVIVMDTDFNHSPELVAQMVRFLDYYDVIIGSRFVMGGGMEDIVRYYLSYSFNAMVRIVLRTQIQDNLSGFFAIRRDKLMRMDMDHIFTGYGEYFIRLLFFAWRHGYKMLEVPVYYQLRRHGQSKSRFLAMLRDYTVTVIKLRFTRGPAPRGRRPNGG